MPGEVGYLYVNHVGDRNSYVSLYRAGSDRVTLVGQAVHFQGTTGHELYEEPPSSVVAGINDFLTGLHLQHFEHWLLRWFYVFGGLAGCVCIATGMLIATLAMLVTNRVLPIDLAQRGDWQKAAFWGAWLLRALALLCSLGGLAWWALAMEVHWQQVRGPHAPLPRHTAFVLRMLGTVALLASLSLCLWTDHGSMAVLVWVMSLAVSAVTVALTLAWRPLWLAWLIGGARHRSRGE